MKTPRLKALLNLWQQFKNLPWERRTLWTGAGLALIPILASLFLPWNAEPQTRTEKSTRTNVDTFIPKGFVLVPIEVQNYEALDSILGRFALVDLFQASTAEHPEQKLVARNVRLLRAPQNPSHFAVLVQEAEVSGVLRFGGSFTVVIKRPANSGTEFVKEPVKRSITYEGG